MRQVHRAGEKTFIDYSGKRPHLVDRRTGEERPVELFVAALGASSYIFAEATEAQDLPSPAQLPTGVPISIVRPSGVVGSVRNARDETPVEVFGDRLDRPAEL
jgi:hypothetical protein